MKNTKKKFKTMQTHFYQGGLFNSSAGIKVCFFGGNSPTATSIASHLLCIGTPVNMVHRNVMDTEIPWGELRLMKSSNPFRAQTSYITDYNQTSDALYKMRVYGDIGMRSFTYAPDLTNDWEIENAIKDCDVVINCIGNNPIIRKEEDYEEANILIPRKLAKICARLKNDPVKRLIHFSANGANPDSICRSLRSKWLGEQEIKEHFPEATILRPTEILGANIVNSFMG